MNNIKIIIDFDNTLVRGEALETLADMVLAENRNKKQILTKIQEITQAGMEGKISFDQSLETRLALFCPTKKHIDKLVLHLKKAVTQSVWENLEFLKARKDDIYIISGGFKDFILPVTRMIGLADDHVLANEFLYEKNVVIGHDKNNPLAMKGGKAKALKNLQLQETVVAIGDGYTDYELKKEGLANTFIAFIEHVEREKVVANADLIAKNFHDVVTYIHEFETGRLVKPKALLLENIHSLAQQTLEKFGFEVEAIPMALTEAELIAKIHDVQVLGIRSKTKVTKRVIKSANQLTDVGAFCIGTEQIDLQACQLRKIAVTNAPFSNTRSVAELVIGEIIMLKRGVIEKNTKLQQGIWDKSATAAHEIRGKTLGIVGYGNIGAQLSVLAEALGMKVCFFDLQDKLTFGNAQRCKTLEELLRLADVVTIHVDGREANDNLIGEKEFARMKPGAIFLNLSRGKVVDIQALAKFIKLGKIGGAAVDVYPVEPDKNGAGFVCPLQNLPNVILTPHIAGSTLEAQKDIGEYVCQKIIKRLNREEKE